MAASTTTNNNNNNNNPANSNRKQQKDSNDEEKSREYNHGKCQPTATGRRYIVLSLVLGDVPSTGSMRRRRRRQRHCGF
jgi:hypothetical protein